MAQESMLAKRPNLLSRRTWLKMTIAPDTLFIDLSYIVENMAIPLGYGHKNES
jgi:hypothetical protein